MVHNIGHLKITRNFSIASLHACAHVYVHVHLHACMYVYIHGFVYRYTNVYVCAHIQMQEVGLSVISHDIIYLVF